MMKRRLATVLAALLLLLPFLTPAATPTNQITELTFPSTKPYPDPFNALTLDLLITRPDGTTSRLPAFYAGHQTWRARFSSPTPGHYTYTTECSDPANPSLHHLTGTIDIIPYTGTNPLYLHGPLQVSPDHAHFEHTDHTPFFWLADTWWMGLCQRLPFDGFQQLTADRAEKGFTVVQLVAGLYPDMPPFDPRGANEAGFPWTQNYERINPNYFDAADKRISYLVDHGLSPCLVGAWGYHLPWLGVEKMKQHWRYLVARYGAYPCFWCIAGEAAMPYYLSKNPAADAAFQKQGWTDVARYVRSIDPFHHPITLHPTDRTRTNITDPNVIDFEMLQTGHGDWSSAPSTLALLDASRADQHPPMPTVNAEVCYEGILGTCHADVVRFMAYASLLHGTAGHTYGANGIWQVNTQQQPYGKSPHGGTYGPTPWDEAMNLPGSRQVALAKSILEQHDFPHLQPHPDFTTYAPLDPPSWGHWIWYPEGSPAHDAPTNAPRYFRKSFTLPQGTTTATLYLSADDRFTAYLNGHPLASRSDWQSPTPLNLTPYLRPGPNTLAIEAENLPAPNVPANPAGLLCSLLLHTPDGKLLNIPSDPTWRTTNTTPTPFSRVPRGRAPSSPAWTLPPYDDSTWPPAKDLGPYPCPPWNTLPSRPPYGPFTAATPDDHTRVTYVPSPRPITLHHLTPHTTYSATTLDPTTGTATDLAPITVPADGTLTLPNPTTTTSPDWLLILTARQSP